MEKGGKLTGGPYWTQNWIEAMWRFTAERFVDFDTGTVDFEALGREEYEFRKALFFRNFKNSPRAREAFEAAADDYGKKVVNGRQGGRPRKNQDFTADGDAREGSQGIRTAAAITRKEPLENDPLGTSATLSAGAPTREDGEFKSDSGDAGNLESATPATISQDAAHRKAAEDRKSSTSCTIYGDAATSDSADESTTVSNNLRRVPHNPYDQETDNRISKDEALDLICAGVMASRPAPVRNGPARPPVRSSAMNSRRPTSREEFHAFVADNNLHEDLAEEWYAIHDARGWGDENGNPIKNWRGALKNFCIKVEQKRRTA